MIERFLTMEKAKEYLGCKDNRTAIKLLQKASIPPTKVGKRFKIDRFAIDDYFSLIQMFVKCIN